MPAALFDLDLPTDGSWAYESRADDFRLTLIEEDVAICYDSARPDHALIEAVPASQRETKP